MYLPVSGHEVLALDAATGEQIWRTPLPRRGHRRARRRVLARRRPARAAHLRHGRADVVALDAASGAPARGFGRDGVKQVAVPYRGMPLIYGNLAIVGAHSGERNQGLAGDTRAYDTRTGELVWTFHTVPLPGEFGTRNLAGPRLAQSFRHQRLGLLHDA